MKPKYISFDKAFERRFDKYKSQLTDDEKEKLKKRLGIFKEDIYDERLKTHKLKGNLKVTMRFQSAIQIGWFSRFLMMAAYISLTLADMMSVIKC